MRKSLVLALQKVMDTNEKSVLMIGDIGAYLFRDIKKSHPDRFFNMGVAEANMVSVASALALDGWEPYVYTIAPFITSRCYDQIRVGVGIHNANVKIIGIGAGMTYSHLGNTHHCIEDLALMRSIPKMVIYSPSDGPSAYQMILSAQKIKGPVYVRLSSDTQKIEQAEKINIIHGKARKITEGKDLTVIATGRVLRNALEAVELLKREKISVRLLDMHTIKPIDTQAVINAYKETKGIITVEEHNIVGGLGSVVAEVLMENASGRKYLFKRIGVNDEYIKDYGTNDEIFCVLGLDSKSIYKKIKSEIKK